MKNLVDQVKILFSCPIQQRELGLETVSSGQSQNDAPWRTPGERRSEGMPWPRHPRRPSPCVHSASRSDSRPVFPIRRQAQPGGGRIMTRATARVPTGAATFLGGGHGSSSRSTSPQPRGHGRTAPPPREGARDFPGSPTRHPPRDSREKSRGGRRGIDRGRRVSSSSRLRRSPMAICAETFPFHSIAPPDCLLGRSAVDVHERRHR